ADAVKAYRRRVAMGGFPEEVWYSLFQIGVLLATRKGGFAPALEALLQAHQFRPARAEPLHRLAVHYRLTKEYELAYLFARRANEIPRPKDDIHFCDEAVYTWRALDELSIAEYWTGRYRQSLAH